MSNGTFNRLYTGEGGVDFIGRSRLWYWITAVLLVISVAAIGIRVTHGVTMHGVSLNCDNTLDHYGHIVPCGIADAGVTTLSEELGRDVTVADLREPLTSAIAAALDGTLRVEKHDL